MLKLWCPAHLPLVSGCQNSGGVRDKFHGVNVDFITQICSKKDSSKVLLQKMVRHPTCMILSNQLGHTEDGWRDALCTPVLLGLLQGRLPRRLCPGRRARLQKVHCRPLVGWHREGVGWPQECVAWTRECKCFPKTYHT